MLLQFEKELAQAVEALTKEQEKAAQAEREKQTQVKKSFPNCTCVIGVDFQNKETQERTKNLMELKMKWVMCITKGIHHQVLIILIPLINHLINILVNSLSRVN